MCDVDASNPRCSLLLYVLEEQWKWIEMVVVVCWAGVFRKTGIARTIVREKERKRVERRRRREV